MTTFGHTTMTRAANRMLTRMVGKGRGPRFIRLLTVPGRRTGLARTTPVVPLVTERGRWLVAPYGEVGWIVRSRLASGPRAREAEIAAVADRYPVFRLSPR